MRQNMRMHGQKHMKKDDKYRRTARSDMIKNEDDKNTDRQNILKHLKENRNELLDI